MTTKDQQLEALWKEIEDILERMAELARKYLELSKERKQQEDE